MDVGTRWLAAAVLAALLPTAAADQALPAAPPSELSSELSSGLSDAQAQACAFPPCGYIVPQLALDFPDKPPCKAPTLGGVVDLTTCMTLPADGESIQLDGMLRWYWDMTQDGTYPIDPQTPIVIQFGGTATNPDWLDLKVEPASFTLDAVEMVHPDNIKTTGTPPAVQVWFWFEQPISVTITRSGAPDAEGLEKIGNANGVQKVFLKAKSNASGAYFKEAFGVEEFRFNAYSDEQIMSATGAAGQDAPAFGPVALLGAMGLAFALVAVRRRD